MRFARVVAASICVLTIVAGAIPALAQGGFSQGAVSQGGVSQAWPRKPIRIIVAFGPGGGSDIVGRIVGLGLQSALGQTVVIENRPGAGGTIGNEAVARAEKDGYTLGIMTAGQIIAAVMGTLRYDTATAFAPISQIGSASLLIATGSAFPARDVAGLIAVVKGAPGKYLFASPSFGATQHLAAELFVQTAGLQMRHVPFRSSPEAITAVLGGDVHVVFDTVSALLGQVQSGELRALAVTGKDRFVTVPDVPTAIESGLLPGYDVTTWYGLFAPAGTPQDVIAKLNATVAGLLADPIVRGQLVTAGLVVQGSSPDAFASFMAAELTRWDGVRRAAGIVRN